MIRTLRIWFAKRRLRSTYLRLIRLKEELDADCGSHLLGHMSSRYSFACREVCASMAALRLLDETAPATPHWIREGATG